MKKLIFIVVFLSCSICLADVPPKDSHYLGKCVKIVNLEEFPDIMLVQYIDAVTGKGGPSIISGKCLSKGYKFNRFRIYSIKKSDFEKFNSLDEIPFKDNKNFISLDPSGYWIPNSNPLKEIIQEYKIHSIENDKPELYLYRETKKYNNGTRNQIKVFPKPRAK